MMYWRAKGIILMMLVPFLALSQQFEGGLLAGLVGSQVGGDKFSGYNKVGFVGGGYVSLNIAPKYDLKLEMEFIQKGSRHTPKANDSVYIDYLLRLNYIEMPLLLTYHINDWIQVEAGPGVAVLVSHKETQNDIDMSRIRPGFRSTNLSILFGLSYHFTENLKLNLRTDNSLLAIRKDSFDGNVKRLFSSWGQYHDILVFSLFYKLG